jgi:Xaa-Pro aminopeptidase
VGGGPNSAVLHFPPSDRRFADGDLILIDAGGEYRGYVSDITRTYPGSGELSPEQAELHALVRRAGLAAIARCTVGTEWRDVHRSAALVIAAGLVDFGLLRGEPESLVEQGAQSIFFPHGIGHMVGLGVRDAGEFLKGRPQREDEFPKLRIDLPSSPATWSPSSRASTLCRRSSATRGFASGSALPSTGSVPSACSSSAASETRTTCSSPTATQRS